MLAEKITPTPVMNWLLELRTRALICAVVEPSDSIDRRTGDQRDRCDPGCTTSGCTASLEGLILPPPQAASSEAMRAIENSRLAHIGIRYFVGAVS